MTLVRSSRFDFHATNCRHLLSKKSSGMNSWKGAKNRTIEQHAAIIVTALIEGWFPSRCLLFSDVDDDHSHSKRTFFLLQNNFWLPAPFVFCMQRLITSPPLDIFLRGWSVVTWDRSDLFIYFSPPPPLISSVCSENRKFSFEEKKMQSWERWAENILIRDVVERWRDGRESWGWEDAGSGGCKRSVRIRNEAVDTWCMWSQVMRRRG